MVLVGSVDASSSAPFCYATIAPNGLVPIFLNSCLDNTFPPFGRLLVDSILLLLMLNLVDPDRTDWETCGRKAALIKPIK